MNPSSHDTGNSNSSELNGRCEVVPQESAPSVSKHPTQPTVTIEFGRSSSANYALAVEIARKNPTYSEKGSGKDIRHSVTFEFDSFDSIRELFELVGRWKNTTFTIDGRMLPASKAFAVLACYSERCRAFNPEEYCFGRDDANDYNDNDLGCRHCGINPYGWLGLKGFGTMQADGVFVVDKNRIIHEVSKNLEDYLWCPALNPKRIEQRLKQIPDTIDPRRNRQWEYVTELEEDKQIAVAVRKKVKRPDQQYIVKDYTELFMESEPSKKVALPDKGNPRKATSKATSGSGCLITCIGGILVALFVIGWALGLL